MTACGAARDGVIEQAGSPLDLYNSPANRFVAGFVGSPQDEFSGRRGGGTHFCG